MAILNYRFGSLNKVKKSDTFSDYRTNETSGISTLKNLSADNFTPDLFSNIQIFKGICLRIYDESTWSAAARMNPMSSPTELTRIVVRIPELHAMICDPFEHVEPDGTLDQSLVDQHPTFTATSVQLDRPEGVGQVVNVSFDDVENQLGGQYLGAVFDEPTPWIPRNNTSKNFFKRPRLPDLKSSDSDFVALASSRAKRVDRTKPNTASARISQEEKLQSLDSVFRPKVESVITALKHRGFKPKIFFAHRTLAEQRILYNEGKSKLLFSFHTAYKNGQKNSYAADIVDERWRWEDAAEANGFWRALGQEAKRVQLIWGGDWTSFRDVAHVQLYDNSELARIQMESR